MKKLVSLSIILLLLNCNKDIYYGYIYDRITKKPLPNVTIIDYKHGQKSISKDNGYFEVEKIKNSSSKLIFQKDLYHTDTINSIQIQNGEKQVELFKGDSIFLLKVKDRDSIYRKNGL